MKDEAKEQQLRREAVTQPTNDLETLELENKLLRARNERLEATLASIKRIAEANT